MYVLPIRKESKTNILHRQGTLSFRIDQTSWQKTEKLKYKNIVSRF